MNLNPAWIPFFLEHQKKIFSWTQAFAPAFAAEFDALDEDPKSVLNLLNAIYFAAPDSPSIRSPAFFRLCDLLDGTVPFYAP